MLCSCVGIFFKLLRFYYNLICVKIVFCLFVFFFNDNVIVDILIWIKRIIVEKSEIVKRWDEEVVLVKKEMVNFIVYYMDVSIFYLIKIVEEL